MNKKVITILLIALCGFSSCDKNEKRTIEAITERTVTEETITSEPKIELINENRWINTAEGLNMRDQPDVSGSVLGTVPAYAKVLLLEEAGEEITLQEKTGKRYSW